MRRLALVALSAAFTAFRSWPAEAAIQGEFRFHWDVDSSIVIGHQVLVPAEHPITMRVRYENQGGKTAPPVAFRFQSPDSPAWGFTTPCGAIGPFLGSVECTATVIFPEPALAPGETAAMFRVEVFPVDAAGDFDPANDTLAIKNLFVYPNLPVLRGSVVKVEPANPKIGDTVVVTGAITNIGFETAANPEHPEGHFFFRIFLADSRVEVALRSVLPRDLEPGESIVVISRPFNLATETTVFVIADPFSPTWAFPFDAHETGLVEEAFDTAFNVASVRLPLIVAPTICDTFADLVAERLEILPDTAFGPNDTFTIRLTTFNRGNIPAEFPNPDSPNVIAFLLDGAGLAAVETSTTVPVDSAFIVTATIPPLGREGVFEVRGFVDVFGHLFEGCADASRRRHDVAVREA